MSKTILVGKTNAGKSSLLNALVRKNISVVHDTEHLTNDVIRFDNGESVILDTPGIEDIGDLDEVIAKSGQVDNVVIVVSPEDFSRQFCGAILQYFREYKCLLVVNKSDLMTFSEEFEFKDIETLYVSATKGYDIDKLRQKLGLDLKKQSQNKTWSIFGRSNVGKSTLANALLNQNRFTVKDQIGTTREVNRETMLVGGRHIELVDTPGYRKNHDIDLLSRASQHRLEDYMNRSGHNLGIMVIDAATGLTRTDRRIFDQLLNSYMMLLAINKVDLVEQNVVFELQAELKRLYPNMKSLAVSSVNRTGITELIRNMEQLEQIPIISTGVLNRWVHKQPQFHSIKYITCTGPGSFAVFTRKPMMPQQIRGLENAICRHFRINGIRLKFRIEAQ